MVQVTFLLTICGSIHTVLDQSTIFGSIHNLRFNPKSVDQSTIFGSIHNLWINPQSADQFTTFGSIYPRYVNQSLICHLWINPQSLVWSTSCRSIHYLWICMDYSATVDTFKSVIAIPIYMWINSHSIDKSTAFHTQLRNPHFRWKA